MHSAAIQGDSAPHRPTLASLSYSMKQVERQSAFSTPLACLATSVPNAKNDKNLLYIFVGGKDQI